LMVCVNTALRAKIVFCCVRIKLIQSEKFFPLYNFDTVQGY